MRCVARLVRLVLAAVVLSATPGLAPAQTSTWTGGGGNGNWNVPANWGGTAPTSGSATAINLAGVVQTNTIQNISPVTPFDLNQLLLAPSAINGFSVGGGPLRFTGSNPLVQVDAPATLRVDSAVTFGANTSLAINTSFPAGPELVLAGQLTAAAGVAVTVNGSTGTGAVITSLGLTPNANPNFAGTLAFGSGAQTLVSLGATNVVPRAAVLDLSNASNFATVRLGTTTGTGTGFADAGYSQQVGRIVGTGTNNAGIQIGAGGQAATLLAGFDGVSSTYAGAFTNSGTGSHFGKVGTGILTLTGNSGTYAGSVSVRDGTLLLDGAAGRLRSATATSAVAVYGGSTLNLNNATTNNSDRLGDAAPVVLGGGTLGLIGGAANASEAVGGFRFASGESLVTITPGAGNAARFTTATVDTGLAQLSPTATVFFRGNNLGLADSATGANTAGVNLNDAAGTVGGIIPYAVGATTNAGGPTSLVGFDATNASVRPLQAADYTTFAASTGTSNVSDGGFTVAAPATINALRATGNVTATGALTLTSGALLNTNAGSVVSGGGGLAFGASGAATAFITTPADLTINSPVAAANLAKSGTGTLTLGGPVTLGVGAGKGTVAVNAGTLTVGPTASFANATTYQVSRGATLNATATGLALGTGQVLTGAGSVTGSVTVGNGATVTPSALAGPDANLASPATLSVGGVTLQGGGAFRVYMNSVLAGPYTQSTIAGGALNLTDASLNTTPFTIRLDALSLTNADIAAPVYDFDPARGYSWTIYTAAGGITGFAPNKFTLDTSDFGSGPALGTFALTAQGGTDLVVIYTPVPEPGTVVGIAALALVLGRTCLRRRPAV